MHRLLWRSVAFQPSPPFVVSTVTKPHRLPTNATVRTVDGIARADVHREVLYSRVQRIRDDINTAATTSNNHRIEDLQVVLECSAPVLFAFVEYVYTGQFTVTAALRTKAEELCAVCDTYGIPVLCARAEVLLTTGSCFSAMPEPSDFGTDYEQNVWNNPTICDTVLHLRNPEQIEASKGEAMASTTSDHIMYCCSNTLQQCGYFERLFSNDWMAVQRNADGYYSVSIDEALSMVNEEAVYAIIRMTQCGVSKASMEQMTSAASTPTLLLMVQAAEFLQAPQFTTQLLTHLTRRLQPNYVCSIWNWAVESNLAEISDECRIYVTQNFGPVSMQPDFLYLRRDSLLDILSPGDITLTTPFVVERLTEWGKYQIQSSYRLALQLRYPSSEGTDEDCSQDKIPHHIEPAALPVGPVSPDGPTCTRVTVLEYIRDLLPPFTLLTQSNKRDLTFKPT